MLLDSCLCVFSVADLTPTSVVILLSQQIVNFKCTCVHTHAHTHAHTHTHTTYLGILDNVFSSSSSSFGECSIFICYLLYTLHLLLWLWVWGSYPQLV